MTKIHINESSSSIYKRTGDVECVHTFGGSSDPAVPRIPTIARLVPVTAIMTRDVVCARADLPAEKVVDLLVDNCIGCLPVVDEDGCPIGMITKRDLVEPFASHARPVRRASGDESATAAMIMLPIVLSIDEHATVLQAAAMMARQAMHHVPVISPKGRLVGIVSSLDIVRWLARNDGIPSDDAPTST